MSLSIRETAWLASFLRSVPGTASLDAEENDIDLERLLAKLDRATTWKR